MGEFITALIVIAVIVGNIYRVAAEFRRRARNQPDPDDAFGEATLRQELERRLREDRERMAPPPRPTRPGAPPPPAPGQYTMPPRPLDDEETEPRQIPTPVARETMTAPPPPPPPPPRAQPQPIPAFKPTQPQPVRKATPQTPIPVARASQAPAVITRAAGPASLPRMAQIATMKSGLHETKGRRRSARIRPESLTPAMMRKVAILSEIYNPPLALRDARQP